MLDAKVLRGEIRKSFKIFLGKSETKERIIFCAKNMCSNEKWMQIELCNTLEKELKKHGDYEVIPEAPQKTEQDKYKKRVDVGIYEGFEDAKKFKPLGLIELKGIANHCMQKTALDRISLDFKKLRNLSDKKPKRFMLFTSFFMNPKKGCVYPLMEEQLMRKSSKHDEGEFNKFITDFFKKEGCEFEEIQRISIDSQEFNELILKGFLIEVE